MGPGANAALADEERTDPVTADAEAAFTALLGRLSRQSVAPGRHFDAYADIDWDAPEMRIEPDDPRFEFGPDHPLGATEWYRSQPQAVRARIGLNIVANQMKTGLEFESVLKRGLLEYASRLPNNSPDFRYVYHEVIEEAQHSLMFQEYVNRSGFDPQGIPRFLRPGTRLVVRLARVFPELFFLFVLGGEDPIDYAQRMYLKSGDDIHPLNERIMRIHVTEEARHLSFARHLLKLRVPRLSKFRRIALAIEAPILLGVMVQLMMRPSPDLVRRYDIPRDVIRQAYRDPKARADTRASLRKVRELCVELGVVTRWSRPLWRALGVWEAPTSRSA